MLDGFIFYLKCAGFAVYPGRRASLFAGSDPGPVYAQTTGITSFSDENVDAISRRIYGDLFRYQASKRGFELVLQARSEYYVQLFLMGTDDTIRRAAILCNGEEQEFDYAPDEFEASGISVLTAIIRTEQAKYANYTEDDE